MLVGCGPSVPDITIHKAVKTGNIAAVKQYLAAGTDVNANDEDGETPLYRAAYHGYKEIAKLLIAEGADVNAKNKGGVTPLDCAVYFGHKATANLLRKHGGKTTGKLIPNTSGVQSLF